MSVYVDNPRLPFGRMLPCHMIADSTAELLEMADEIGVRRKWIQKAGTSGEHFDLSLGKRATALVAGAFAIRYWELGRIIADRRRRERGLPERLDTTAGMMIAKGIKLIRSG